MFREPVRITSPCYPLDVGPCERLEAGVDFVGLGLGLDEHTVEQLFDLFQYLFGHLQRYSAGERPFMPGPKMPISLPWMRKGISY